jgi:2-iminobutanoate/2-iminopropanoate deaminase
MDEFSRRPARLPTGSRHMTCEFRRISGGTLDHVVKITTYVTDVRHRPEFRTIREEFFGTKGPASTMVEVCALAHPDYLIEVEAVAAI